jgi:hypothetical protein
MVGASVGAASAPVGASVTGAAVDSVVVVVVGVPQAAITDKSKILRRRSVVFFIMVQCKRKPEDQKRIATMLTSSIFWLLATND